MSVRDGIETNDNGYPEYRESIQGYADEDKKDWWIRAEMQIEATREYSASSIAVCRYAVLRLQTKKAPRYVVYDRLLSRIVDGVYFGVNDPLGVAQWLNEGGKGHPRSPNGVALGLIYPNKKNLPGWDGTWKSKDWTEKSHE